MNSNHLRAMKSLGIRGCGGGGGVSQMNLMPYEVGEPPTLEENDIRASAAG